MSELWAKWEGEVINGEFPLRRLVGVSDHSGVFLTEARGYGIPNAAIKLVPAIPTLAESQLAHWTAAASLSHQRLLRLFASGRCQLGNLHFLYVLMEYADQNLAQLLESRPLTEIEARETLPPTLDGLSFLHSRNLVQGQLKPSNILVVGEQLKLASDTIRPAGEAATSISMLSVYDPPEGRDGSFSTAGDIWALGVTLYEALTQATPTRPDDRSHGVVLPPDFPLASADVIRECLSRRPSDRPTVAALQAWITGKIRYPGVPSSGSVAASTGVASTLVGARRASSAGAAAGVGAAPGAGAADGARAAVRARAAVGARAAAGAGSAPAVAVIAAAGAARPSARPPAPPPSASPATTSAAPSAEAAPATPGGPGRLTIRAVVERNTVKGKPPAPRSYLPWAIAAVVVLAIALSAVRMLGGHSNTSPPATSNTPSTNSFNEKSQSAGTPGRATPGSQAAPTAPQTSAPSKSERSHHQATVNDAPDSVIHQEIPNVPHSALATIHGHVKVAVRVTVDSSGNVVDDTLDHAGPSRYFARVASQAARKWKFAPVGEKSNRQWLVHFDFSRTGTTAHATTS